MTWLNATRRHQHSTNSPLLPGGENLVEVFIEVEEIVEFSSEESEDNFDSENWPSDTEKQDSMKSLQQKVNDHH